MINSLRPLLADCPAVLQQKWHWEHLSMLPDNAHKCEICQTQYVNNHNCTGWGHVQANPREMLLDDCGVSRFQALWFLTNAFLRGRVREVEGQTRGRCAACREALCISNSLPRRRPLVLMFVINSLRVFVEHILKKCSWRPAGPAEGMGRKKKSRFKVKLQP